MKNSSGSTHRPDSIDPQRFRNLATGVGQTSAQSERTGCYRAQAVVDSMPKKQLRAAPASYPDPTPQYEEGGRYRCPRTGAYVSPSKAKDYDNGAKPSDLRSTVAPRLSQGSR